MLEKATRVLTEEDKIQMEVEITGKTGEKRKVEVSSIKQVTGLLLA